MIEDGETWYGKSEGEMPAGERNWIERTDWRYLWSLSLSEARKEGENLLGRPIFDPRMQRRYDHWERVREVYWRPRRVRSRRREAMRMERWAPCGVPNLASIR
jgi:hypothetical protein